MRAARRDSANFLVGYIDPPAGLADPEEFLQEHIRLVEDLQRMAAGDEIELIVLEQHLGGIAIGIFDIRYAEAGRHVARIGEARFGMVERDNACRLELLPHQHGEVADATTYVCHRHTRAQAVTREDLALVA